MTTRPEMEALLYRVQDCYPASPPVRPGTVTEWQDSKLGRFDGRVVFAALDRYRDENRWPPTPADLIEYATALMLEEGGHAPLVAIDDGPVVDPETARANVRQIREMLKTVTKRVP